MTKDDIEDVVARWTGVPMTAIREEEVAKLLRVKANCIAASSARRKPSRYPRHPPLARRPKSPASGRVFLFLGPTGVGKTEIAQALAEFLFGVADPLRYVRFAGNTASQADRLNSGLCGIWEAATPERVKRAPYSIILLGNREGAPGYLQHPVAVFEDSQLTDGLGNRSISEHHHHHDLEPGCPVSGKTKPDRLQRPRLRHPPGRDQVMASQKA